MRDGISQNAGNESRGVAESQRRRHDGTRGRRGRLSPRHEATPFCTCFFIARRAFLRFFFAFEVRLACVISMRKRLIWRMKLSGSSHHPHFCSFSPAHGLISTAHAS